MDQRPLGRLFHFLTHLSTSFLILLYYTVFSMSSVFLYFLHFLHFFILFNGFYIFLFSLVLIVLCRLVKFGFKKISPGNFRGFSLLCAYVLLQFLPSFFIDKIVRAGFPCHVKVTDHSPDVRTILSDVLDTGFCAFNLFL